MEQPQSDIQEELNFSGDNFDVEENEEVPTVEGEEPVDSFGDEPFEEDTLDFGNNTTTEFQPPQQQQNTQQETVFEEGVDDYIEEPSAIQNETTYDFQDSTMDTTTRSEIQRENVGLKKKPVGKVRRYAQPKTSSRISTTSRVRESVTFTAKKKKKKPKKKLKAWVPSGRTSVGVSSHASTMSKKELAKRKKKLKDFTSKIPIPQQRRFLRERKENIEVPPIELLKPWARLFVKNPEYFVGAFSSCLAEERMKLALQGTHVDCPPVCVQRTFHYVFIPPLNPFVFHDRKSSVSIWRKFYLAKVGVGEDGLGTSPQSILGTIRFSYDDEEEREGGFNPSGTGEMFRFRFFTNVQRSELGKLEICSNEDLAFQFRRSCGFGNMKDDAEHWRRITGNDYSQLLAMKYQTISGDWMLIPESNYSQLKRFCEGLKSDREKTVYNVDGKGSASFTNVFSLQYYSLSSLLKRDVLGIRKYASLGERPCTICGKLSHLSGNVFFRATSIDSSYCFSCFGPFLCAFFEKARDGYQLLGKVFPKCPTLDCTGEGFTPNGNRKEFTCSACHCRVPRELVGRNVWKMNYTLDCVKVGERSCVFCNRFCIMKKYAIVVYELRGRDVYDKTKLDTNEIIATLSKNCVRIRQSGIKWADERIMGICESSFVPPQYIKEEVVQVVKKGDEDFDGNATTAVEEDEYYDEEEGEFENDFENADDVGDLEATLYDNTDSV